MSKYHGPIDIYHFVWLLLRWVSIKPWHMDWARLLQMYGGHYDVIYGFFNKSKFIPNYHAKIKAQSSIFGIVLLGVSVSAPL
eukprot:9520433-Karenia_brevis.AAC.1